MPTIFVTSRTGEERPVEFGVTDSPTLMEAIRNDGSFDLIAMCGGMLSCSTCHVYLPPDWADKVDFITEDEQELVATAEQRMPTSRLSCQIRLGPQHDGLRVTVAPEH